MKSMRKHLINWLFEKSMVFYCKFKKKKPWGITSQELVSMPSNTFGHHLGCLLVANEFELIPKVERHDAYHLLTGYSTAVEDEIALQYACFGNGKRTPYLLGVLFLGTFILPDYLPHYLKAYQFGQHANSFHHFDFKTVLPLDFDTFRQAIFSKNALDHLSKNKCNYQNK